LIARRNVCSYLSVLPSLRVVLRKRVTPKRVSTLILLSLSRLSKYLLF